MMAKACLAVLCVFVFSSMGNAQSFMEATEAQQTIRPILEELRAAEFAGVQDTKVKQVTDSGAVIEVSYTAEEIQEANFRSVYIQSLSEYIDWVNTPNVVSNAIERNHQKMMNRYAHVPSTLADQLKAEVTDLLTK